MLYIITFENYIFYLENTFYTSLYHDILYHDILYVFYTSLYHVTILQNYRRIVES